jgi:8-amino-7-oxononanoate synthase
MISDNKRSKNSSHTNDDIDFNTTKTDGISWMDEIIQNRLRQRIQRGTLRRLLRSTVADSSTTTMMMYEPYHDHPASNIKSSHVNLEMNGGDTTTGTSIDFSSNDYLGLARDMEQYHSVEKEMEQYISSFTQSSYMNNNKSCPNEDQSQYYYYYSSIPLLGSTGSRLLSGDTTLLHDVEDYLGQIHHATSALLCNSGYDANISVVSTLPCTCILYDSYIHNSLHMGLRLWQSQSTASSASSSAPASSSSSILPTTGVPILDEREENVDTRKATASFQHNNVPDLRQKLQYYKAQGHSIVILVESVYSMDGDIAPVRDILDLAESYQSLVVVDEAHGFGVFGATQSGNDGDVDNNDNAVESSIHMSHCGGTGVLAMTECEQHPALLAAIYTYGKAAGCHGAVICAPHIKYMKEYWINYAYPIIYSTALPLHSILTIRCSYRTITGTKGQRLRRYLSQIIQYFQTHLTLVLDRLRLKQKNHPYRILPSSTPIQALIVPGNRECSMFCQKIMRISNETIQLFPIKAPTVPIGQERIRMVLHAHNTMSQIDTLLRYIEKALQASTSTNISTPQFSKL